MDDVIWSFPIVWPCDSRITQATIGRHWATIIGGNVYHPHESTRSVSPRRKLLMKTSYKCLFMSSIMSHHVPSRSMIFLHHVCCFLLLPLCFFTQGPCWPCASSRWKPVIRWSPACPLLAASDVTWASEVWHLPVWRSFNKSWQDRSSSSSQKHGRKRNNRI